MLHFSSALLVQFLSAILKEMLRQILPLGPRFHGDPENMIRHVLNLSFPGVDSEAVMLATKDLIAISNGSACTSSSYEPSHVLKAMQLPEEAIRGALRISWCHATKTPDWSEVVARVRALI